MKARSFHPAKTTALVEASRPKAWIISNHVAKSKGSTGAKPKLGPLVPRKNMNWFHPSVWVQIEFACRAVGWPFSPADIKRYLMRTNPEQFKVLHHQRLSDWIDKSQRLQLRFTESVQCKIGKAQAMEPGGHNSRIGILVSGLRTYHGPSDHLPRRNTLLLWSLLSST